MSTYIARIGRGESQRDIKFDKDWIINGIELDTDLYANEFGKYIANNGLSTSSIRNVFSEVKRLEMKIDDDFEDIKNDFILLSPKFQYAVKRAKNPKSFKYKRFNDMMPKYRDTILEAHRAVIEGGDIGAMERYKRFANFFEAVLAYHKVYNGEN